MKKYLVIFVLLLSCINNTAAQSISCDSLFLKFEPIDRNELIIPYDIPIKLKKEYKQTVAVGDKKMEGSVYYSFIVDSIGKQICKRVLRYDNSNILKQADSLVNSWQFYPAKNNNQNLKISYGLFLIEFTKLKSRKKCLLKR